MARILVQALPFTFLSFFFFYSLFREKENFFLFFIPLLPIRLAIVKWISRNYIVIATITDLLLIYTYTLKSEVFLPSKYGLSDLDVKKVCLRSYFFRNTSTIFVDSRRFSFVKAQKRKKNKNFFLQIPCNIAPLEQEKRFKANLIKKLFFI